jgi:hypothetical protein
MDSPQDFSTEIFFEGQETKLWPRRLLHVPSMISVEREGKNTYMGVDKPQYNIISYTWGRFEVREGPSLQVKNVSWKIPSINPSRFTVEEFETTLRLVSPEGGFVWVDVACIDQENETIKMDEIGRQAGIFFNAKDAFIWLHGSSLRQLQEKFDKFFDLVARLEGESIYDVSFDESTTITINWEPDNADSEFSIGENTFLPHCLKDRQWIIDMQRALSGIIEDKWFSSLWTLQEASLRPTASIVSRDGSLIPRNGFAEIALANFVHGVGEIERHLLKTKEIARRNGDHGLVGVFPLIQLLEASVQCMGLCSWENPVTLYGSARSRQCVNPLDRIYGIMQIFGFRLGASADPTRSYTLDELEHQFAAAINMGSPVMGQLFVHSASIELGKCWRVAQTSDMSTVLRLNNLMNLPLARFELDGNNRPKLTGLICQFRRISQQWTLAETRNEGYNFWSVDGAVHSIVLDENEYWHSRLPEDLRHIDTENFAENQLLANMILERCGDDIEVFLLGRLVDPDEDEDDSPTTHGSVGLLGRQNAFGDRIVWQRLGVCVWAMDVSRNDLAGLWTSRSYILA